MIRICLIIPFFLLSINTCFSQVIEGRYYPKPELKSFEGTWVGSNNGDSLVIKITSQKTFLKGPNIYTDRLVGQHKYSHNGTIVENSLKSGKYTLTFGNIEKKEPNVLLHFFFDDISKSKRGMVSLKLNSMHAKTAIWVLKNAEGVRLVEGFDPSFTLPKELILHKRE